MITLFLLDSDTNHRYKLETLLSTRFKELCIISADNYSFAEHSLSMHKIDVFLLHITADHSSCNHCDALLFGKRIRKEVCYHTTPIIYTASNLNHIQTALNETHCYKYLVLPYEENELLSTIQSLLENQSPELNSIILVDIYGVYYKIEKREILYIEAAGKQMQIYCASQSDSQAKVKKIITSRYRLQDFVRMFGSHFIRCHKRYLVNQLHIYSYDRKLGSLQVGNMQIPVGRTYKDYIDHLF